MGALVSRLQSSLNRTWRIEVEVDAGVGVADVVVFRRQPRTNREIDVLARVPPRLAPLLDPTTSVCIHTYVELAVALGIPKLGAQRVERQLRQLGLFNGRAPGKLASVKRSPFENIIAIEAKLSDWSRALVQAYRNRQFADESWVVLDHRYHQAALAQLERFERAGVGLASVDTQKNLFIHLLATASPAMSATKRWHAEAALARRAILSRPT